MNLALLLMLCTLHMFLIPSSSSSPSSSSPLNITLLSTLPRSEPWGTRLFLTQDDNILKLVWCCVKSSADNNPAVEWWHTNDINIIKHSKFSEQDKILLPDYDITTTPSDTTAQLRVIQYNITLTLKYNTTLKYRVSCDGETYSRDLEVYTQYWDNADRDSTEDWTVLSVGSLGLYNTTLLTLDTLLTAAMTYRNVLWVLPGGIIQEHNVTAPRGQHNITASWPAWLAWLRTVERVTCCVPVVSAVSELELQDDLYKTFLPQYHGDYWYSFQHKNLHIVCVCLSCNLTDNSVQFKWLDDDLRAAASSNNTHWTMIVGHQPIYRSTYSLYPEVLTDTRKQLDKLLDKYNVDFGVWSHERWYERTRPMRHFKVSDQRLSSKLDNVNGTIHYTCGTGGMPLQPYNMAKYEDTFHYIADRYGVCCFHRQSNVSLLTSFLTSHQGILNAEDIAEYTKKLGVLPADQQDAMTFSRFFKTFGIVVLIGVLLMGGVTVFVKLVQKYDPSFITDKIRNIKRKREDCVELDSHDLTITGTDADKVMLIEPEEDASFPSTHDYNKMMI